MTALMNAINKNDLSLVRQLIENGINVNELDANQDAPVVIAAYKGYDQILKSLLEAGMETQKLCMR